MQEVLYRFFDSQGTLLYVGISRDWMSRLTQHQKHADFFSAVAGMTLERFPDRASVVAAELRAIRDENPLFNRADNPNYRTWQTHFREVLDMCVKKRKVDDTHGQIVHNLVTYAGAHDNFGTGKWFSEHFPAEWYELSRRNNYDCELCEAVATHPTTHSWGEGEEEL
jgi:hypothetical protein